MDIIKVQSLAPLAGNITVLLGGVAPLTAAGESSFEWFSQSDVFKSSCFEKNFFFLI